MHIIHRWKALGAFFVWTEVFPWTTCFSPNPLLKTWHTYFMDTMSYPRSTCRPIAWKKVLSNAWDALLGKDWIETGFLRATVGKDKLLVHFFHNLELHLCPSLMFLIFCIWNYAESTLLEIHFAAAQFGIWQGLKWISSQLGEEDNDVTGIAKGLFSFAML